jgi:hypothetical protein
MLAAILIILILLWFLGYVRIEGLNIPDIVLFTINGQAITLWNILILAVILWALGVLPSPIRQIAFVILILWILSILGILAFPGLSSLLVIAVIAGIVFSLLGL